MNEWKEDQGANEITFIPDGNGEFSEGMGMLVDKEQLGFGKRSWRYSMLVKDGVVQKMFIEADVDGDPFDVSDADTMLNYIASDAKVPASVTVMSRKGCPFCAKARDLLEQHSIDYEQVELGSGVSTKSLYAVSGVGTTPQVFIDGRLVGGSDDLEAFFNKQDDPQAVA